MLKSAKQAVKRIAERAAPATYARWHDARVKAEAARIVRLEGLDTLARQVAALCQNRVQSGPFAGLVYPDTTLNAHATPKLLGCYEAELHPALDQVLQTAYDSVVDIGSAEGYYAVGLALKLPEPERWRRVYAYDMDADARELGRQTIAANDCAERLELGEKSKSLTCRPA